MQVILYYNKYSNQNIREHSKHVSWDPIFPFFKFMRNTFYVLYYHVDTRVSFGNFAVALCLYVTFCLFHFADWRVRQLLE